MSRAYRVTWVTVSSNVTTSDTLTMNLSLLGILAAGEMAALLRDELERAGWKREGDGSMTRALDGMEATLAPDGSKITVTAGAEGAITARGTNRDDAAKNLEQTEAREKQRLQGEVAKRLSAAEPDLRAKVGEAIQRVYVEALRKKAASMGAIESVQEGRSSDGEYEVTIKVRT